MYYNLKTKQIKYPFITQNINEDILFDLIQDCYSECAFSTFPYHIEKINSKESIEKYKCGDCVALSYYLKKRLKNKNIISYLIPATIPKKYRKKGYLNVSHVALAIPLSENSIYVIDVSFYFLNPVKIDVTKKENLLIFSKNIYSIELNNNLKDYTSIDTIHGIVNQTDSILKLNQYQTIDDNTYKIDCYYTNDISDVWSYFITEVINPDLAITTFFINIKKNPFIVITDIDDNGLCKAKYIIRHTDNKFTIKNLIGEEYDVNYISKHIEKYFNYDIKKNLINFTKVDEIININD